MFQNIFTSLPGICDSVRILCGSSPILPFNPHTHSLEGKGDEENQQVDLWMVHSQDSGIQRRVSVLSPSLGSRYRSRFATMTARKIIEEKSSPTASGSPSSIGIQARTTRYPISNSIKNRFDCHLREGRLRSFLFRKRITRTAIPPVKATTASSTAKMGVSSSEKITNRKIHEEHSQRHHTDR